jgi:hypothetical protein
VLDSTVELVFIQDCIQSVVKRIPRRLHYIAACYPKILLSLPLSAGSHRHVGIDAPNIIQITRFIAPD